MQTCMCPVTAVSVSVSTYELCSAVFREAVLVSFGTSVFPIFSASSFVGNDILCIKDLLIFFPFWDFKDHLYS